MCSVGNAEPLTHSTEGHADRREDELRRQCDAARDEIALLRESREWLETLLRHAAVMIVTLDRDGTIISTNQAPVARPLTAIIGRNCLDFVPAAAHEQCAARLRAVFSTARPDHCEFAMPNGRWAEIHLVPVVVGGRVTIVVATVHDMTRCKRAEQRSRHRLAELAHVHRVNTMGNMVAELAHELSQPLYAIANYAYAGAERVRSGPSDDELLGWLDRISDEAQRAGAIIRRVGTLVRRGSPRRGEVDLAATVTRVLDLVRPRMRLAQIDAALVCPSCGIRVTGDRVQIEQVVMNLVANAIDAITAARSECRRIRVEMSDDGRGYARVSVRDTGLGMTPEALRRVFTPFQTTKPDGMGMGLAICRSIVEDHGGRIHGSCNPDIGCTFSFTVPLFLRGQDHGGIPESVCRR